MSKLNLFDGRIIIGGLPRSGSTLLRFFLDANKEIISGPETAFFTRPLFETQHRKDKLYSQIQNKLGIMQPIYLDAIKEKNSILAFDRLMVNYRDITSNGSKRYWAEKTPNNCFHYHRLSKESDFEIRFISTIRNGLDVVTSEYPKSDLRYKERRYWVSVQQYIDCMKAIFCFEDLNHYIFSYEKFCMDPYTEGERLCKFIGVEFDSSVINNFNKSSSVTRDMTKVIQPKLVNEISNQWVGRWKDASHSEQVNEFLSSNLTVSINAEHCR